jgi:hypothetical protein
MMTTVVNIFQSLATLTPVFALFILTLFLLFSASLAVSVTFFTLVTIVVGFRASVFALASAVATLTLVIIANVFRFPAFTLSTALTVFLVGIFSIALVVIRFVLAQLSHTPQATTRSFFVVFASFRGSRKPVIF